MQATIVDLRYKMHEILKALDRNEDINISYHGKEKAIMKPIKKAVSKEVDFKEYSFIGGSWAEDERTVPEIMRELRGGRYNDI